MNFGEALDFARRGKYVSRAGWNGKGMVVYLVSGHTFEREYARGPVAVLAAECGLEKITYRDHLDMRYADGTIGVWLASQSDMLAEDWFVVDQEDLGAFVRGELGAPDMTAR